MKRFEQVNLSILVLEIHSTLSEHFDQIYISQKTINKGDHLTKTCFIPSLQTDM